MKLISFPSDKYEDYRLDIIFDGYKWDPQYLDNNTIAKHALILSRQEHEELIVLTEKLDRETVSAEQLLYNNKELSKPLALPRKIRKQLWKTMNYQADKHIRLMRYDFHPTEEGKWAISEVNSDVPGGFAEASLMPEIAVKFLSGGGGNNNSSGYTYINFGDNLADAIVKKVKPEGTVAFIHCTSYSDDRQVMQFMGDKLTAKGFKAIYAAADHLKFEDNNAISILDGNEGAVDAIVRFTPIEWLVSMKQPIRAFRKATIKNGYFDTTTPSCNHPIAVLAQTKRFPLVWDALEEIGTDLTTWRELLPETIEVKDAQSRTDKDDFIFKPVYGRVGENISIKKACTDEEYKAIIKDVKRNKSKYLAQKKFNSKPLNSDEGESYHVCLGCFCVDGKAAGYYARASIKPRIDSSAADIPVLVEGK